MRVSRLCAVAVHQHRRALRAPHVVRRVWLDWHLSGVDRFRPRHRSRDRRLLHPLARPFPGYARNTGGYDIPGAVTASAGGGAAASVQGLTLLARGASLVSTGGLANPIVATAELGGSILTSALAVFIPIVAVLGLAGFAFVAVTTARTRPARPAA